MKALRLVATLLVGPPALLAVGALWAVACVGMAVPCLIWGFIDGAQGRDL